MGETGCVGHRISDAEFVSIFFPSFDKLSERQKEVAVGVTRAFVDKTRRVKVIDAESIVSYYPDFKTLDEKEKEVALDVSKALDKRIRKESRKIKGGRKNHKK